MSWGPPTKGGMDVERDVTGGPMIITRGDRMGPDRDRGRPRPNTRRRGPSGDRPRPQPNRSRVSLNKYLSMKYSLVLYLS